MKFWRLFKQHRAKNALAKQAHKRNDDWLFFIHEINNKLISMATATKKYSIVAGKHQCVREMWRTHLPLKHILDTSWWPRTSKTSDTGETEWYNEHGIIVGVTENILEAEQQFFKTEMEDFCDCLSEYCRNWWW